MMSRKILREIVQDYLDKLEYTHPLINSEKFVINSYSKTACENLLREIDIAETLPFDLTPFEILDSFCEKMKNFASLNAKNALLFRVAEDVTDYIIEECWRRKWKNN